MKTIKLLILQGAPASGKSTFALKLAKENPTTWIRVCRDDIREMCGKYWVPNREKLITKLEMHSVELALQSEYNVVVDATNLNKSTINSWYDLLGNIKTPNKNLNIELEFKRFETPFWKCVYRDIKRGFLGEKKVGFKVIKYFYNKYYD